MIILKKQFLAMLLALCWLLFGMMALAEDDEFEEFDDDPFDELDDISGYGVEQHTFGDFRCLLNEETGNIITACYIGNDTEIVVPAEIEGHRQRGCDYEHYPAGGHRVSRQQRLQAVPESEGDRDPRGRGAD